jgi:hypothetical protein
VIGRSDAHGTTTMRPFHLDSERWDQSWSFTVVKGVFEDELASLDLTYDVTHYPTSVIAGPFGVEEAREWCAQQDQTPDSIQHLDRKFVLRDRKGAVSPPIRIERLSSLSEAEREGAWRVIRADTPFDALGHVRRVS